MALKPTGRWALAGAIILAAAFGAWLFLRAYLDGPVPVGAPSPVPEGAEWIDLLDDAHAGSWKNLGDDKEIFEISDGALHIFGRSIYPLRYVTYDGQPFDDFELYFQVKVSSGANSGVFLRAKPGDPVYRGFEIQVLDDHGKPPSKNGSGAIYDVVTPMFNMALPPGAWNSYRIRVSGAEVSVSMNGWPIIATDFSLMTEPYGKFTVPYASLPRSGRLMVQDHGGEVWYRHMKIRPLGGGKATAKGA